jgi:hypothetical protein
MLPSLREEVLAVGGVAHGAGGEEAQLGVLQHGLDLFPRDTWEPFEKIVEPGPASRFSNRAFTGTRVPLTSQTPPTFSGCRSTTRHWLQSSMVQEHRNPCRR